MECKSLDSGWMKDWNQPANVIASYRATGRKDWFSYRVFWCDKRGRRRAGYYIEPMHAEGSLLPVGGPYRTVEAACRATWVLSLNAAFEV